MLEKCKKAVDKGKWSIEALLTNLSKTFTPRSVDNENGSIIL